MPNQAGIICNEPIHDDVELISGTDTSTIKLYVNQGIFYANEGNDDKPPPLTWANYSVYDTDYGHNDVMAFCRTGVFITAAEDTDFWPQFYRPFLSHRLT